MQRPGDITFPLVQQFVDDVVEVTEDEICRAVVVLLERSKLMVEGAGAAGLAALLAGKVTALGKAVCVLSGGNLDAGDAAGDRALRPDAATAASCACAMRRRPTGPAHSSG